MLPGPCATDGCGARLETERPSRARSRFAFPAVPKQPRRIGRPPHAFENTRELPVSRTGSPAYLLRGRPGRPDIVRRIFVEAHELDQLRIRTEAIVQLGRERLRIRLGVLDRLLELQVAVLHAVESLRDLPLRGDGAAADVEPP